MSSFQRSARQGASHAFRITRARLASGWGSLRNPFFLCLLGALLGSLPGYAQLPHLIRACSNGDFVGQFPRFTFHKIVDGKQIEETTGYSVDMIQTILRAKGLDARVDLIPWYRCMAEVERGSYDLLLDASNSEERAQKYLVTPPYYSRQNIYFYFKQRPPGKVENANDLRRLRVCGQLGYNYSSWGILNADVDRGARNLKLAMEKLKLGRCDIVLSRIEEAEEYRFSMSADDAQLNELAWGQIPGMPPVTFHMMVSRNLPYSAQLDAILTQGIQRMMHNGEAARLKSHYPMAGQKNFLK
jgi:polar amino acid transport system substrate-binding protein